VVDTEMSATGAGPRCLAFVFPMASGHINPSLPVARGLVKLGHQVHYLCREQMREAIEDTGATFHSDVENEPELYQGREPSMFGALEAIQKEYDCEDESMMVASCKLQEVMLEMMLPGVLRWLCGLRADAVVYCPLMNVEAALAGRVLGIPRVALLTTAGPGSLPAAIGAMLAQEGLTAEAMLEMRESFEPRQEAVRRARAEYDIEIGLSSFKPMGKMEGIADSTLTLVTTCADLQDPVPPELAQAYDDAGVRFVAVGPLLDEQGARRAAGHKHKFQSEGGEEQRQQAQAQGQRQHGVGQRGDPLALLKEAREAGRRVVLASMGTVITGDSPDFGWEGRAVAAGGERRGLTGRELCQAAWGGVFDAFGADGPEDGPLLLVSLGPQPDALGPLRAPANALCLPVLPQVDVLKAGVDLFLTHGGQNSFTEALAAGVPVVVCPGFGDQPVNAQKAVALGVGLRVERPVPAQGQEADAAAAYREQVAAAMRKVSASGHFRDAAERCAERLQAAGGVPRAVELVLKVAATGCAHAQALNTKVAEPVEGRRAAARVAGA